MYDQDSDDIIMYTDSIRRADREVGLPSSSEKDSRHNSNSHKKKPKKALKQSPKATDYQTFGNNGDSQSKNNTDEKLGPMNEIPFDIDSNHKTEPYNTNGSDAPILFLDVNFGRGNVTRIVMYENDTPEELADAFWLEHNLDLEKKQKLVCIIKKHLESVLDKIEESPSEENLDNLSN